MKFKKLRLYFFWSLIVGFYFIFRMIFFEFFGNSSVDVLIGCTIFFLFFLIYKKGRFFIYSHLWSLTKNLYLNYISLFKLLVSLRKLILGYNQVYLEYFRYNVFALKIISKTMNIIYKQISLNLLKKFQINFFINKLNLKFLFVNSKVNSLPIEYSIQSNANFELNIFLSYDILFFFI